MDNALFQNVFNVSSIGFAHLEVTTGLQNRNRDFRFTDSNPALEKITGLKQEKITGKTVRELFPPNEAGCSGWTSLCDRIALAGGSAEFEHYFESSERWYHVHVHFTDKSFITLLFVDITGQKKSEVLLQINEKDLRESQRISQVGSWRLDINTNQVTWTEELYKMYGFDPSLPPPPYTEHMKLFTPESWGRLSKALALTRETGIPYTLELETVRKDGSNGWMWVHGEADADQEGKIVSLWGAAQDITSRKNGEARLEETNQRLRLANEDLKRSEQVLRLFVEHSPAAIAMFDREMRYMVTSQRYVSDYRLDKQNLAGLSHYDVFPEMTEVHKNIHRRCLEGFVEKNNEDFLPRHDGTFDWVRWELRPWYEDKGEIGGLIFFSEVITEQKNAADEIKWLNEDLQLMNAITNAASSHMDFNDIVNIIATHLKVNFSTHLVSIFLPDPKTGKMEMFSNNLDPELVRKIERIIRRPIPVISLNSNTFHPFSEIEKTGMGILSVGKKEMIQRLSGYLQGTPWPSFVQKLIKPILPLIYDLLEYRSSASVAMNFGGKIAGYFEVGSKKVMTRRDLERLQSVANHLASVIARFDAEKKRQESEERMSNAFTYAAIGMAFVSPEGKWLRVNPSVPAMLGYTEEELLGKTFQEITHPDDLDKDLDYVKQMLEGTIRTYQLEKRYFHKSGSIVWAWLSVSLVHDHEGKPLHFISQIQDITQRKKFENELGETLEKLHFANVTLEKRVEERTKEILEISGLQKAILTNAPLTILTTNTEGVIQSINPAGEKMLGYSAEEIVGKKEPLFFYDENEMVEFCRKTKGISHPTSVDIYEAALQYMFQKTTEWTWVRKNGEKFPVRITHSTIFDDNGILLGYMGLIIDITEEKQASDLLRKSEAENSAIIQAVPDLMFRIRRDGTYLDAHCQNDSSLYVPKEAFIGKKITEILPPDLAEQSMNSIEKAFATGNIDQYEYTLPVHGKDRYFENRITAISDNEVLAIIRDITLRKESETALKMQSAAFESFALAIIITDINGYIQWSNSAFTKLTGYSHEEAKGKTPGELVKSGRQDKAFFKSFWNTILGKNVWTGELINRKKDGTLYYEEQTIAPVMDSRGEIANFISIKIDITARKQAQEELLKAKNEAEKANKAKSMFLSRMSHELRTPMNSILGFAQLLEMGELSQKQRKGVFHIINNGKHLLDLINEVLDISGIEAGKQALVTENIDLKPLIHEVTDSMQGAAAKHSISVSFGESSSERIFILADRIRVRQILINLIGNAIKYNVEGGSVTIRTKHIPDQERIRISITDTGAGINPEDIGKLFQPFERIGADKTETEGTGLGLMVVKKLTEAMGGTVGVESIAGSGSTFWFELPRGLEPDRNRPDGHAPESGKIEKIRQEATILYVEDNLSNIELVDEILREQRPGVRLVTTGKGLQTTELVREHNPALILLDLDLPDIQGYQVLEQLSGSDSTRSVPVVVVSADAMPFQIEKLMNAGAKDYVTKPLNIARFLKVIDSFIRPETE